MKIAVLFGSFNPLTNSHVEILKSAVKQLNADKGLFVATNGQYLKRKTVKISDAFYLTEEERQESIEKVCEAEDKLAFWGFEMGGANPKRYKTLCKIKKQYPDAEIFEVQGADKVRSIPKFGDAEDYVANIKFAVFGRKEIDLNKLFETDTLLGKHKDSFTILPALEEGAEISSTEVRCRFYAGENYSDLVPTSTLAVLVRHKPSEFTISFADRMKTIINSGRFGVNTAQKEIYSLNTKLFNDWKKGESQIDFGDYTTYLDGTKLYKKPYNVNGVGNVYDCTQTGCISIDCVDLAERLISNGLNPAILNLASATRPGGGYDKGLSAQEESLCRSSNLSLSLYQYSDPKYKNIQESGVPHKCIGYPFDINYGGIYTPNVMFFRHGKSKLYTLREKPFKCDVITVAGLSFNGRSDYSGKNELEYRSESGGFTSEGNEIMLNKIRTIFRMAVEHGKESIVLGALSCGAYKCPPEEVAKQFRTVIEEPEFKNKFKLLVFAILEKPRKPHGFNGKFAPFYREFGEYNLD